MYLLAPFILQNFLKKSQSYEDKHHFRDQNGPFVLNKNFFVQTIFISFIYLLDLFTVQNLKSSYSGSRIMTMHHFWAQNGPFASNKFFLENFYHHSNLPISPFHCAKCKKNPSSRSRVMNEYVQFLGPKGLISPNEIFFRKPVHEPCFFYSCLS